MTRWNKSRKLTNNITFENVLLQLLLGSFQIQISFIYNIDP
jgi:hypothetical protein